MECISSPGEVWVTEVQYQIFIRLAMGECVKEIAYGSGRHVSTIRNHIARAQASTGLSTYRLVALSYHSSLQKSALNLPLNLT